MVRLTVANCSTPAFLAEKLRLELNSGMRERIGMAWLVARRLNCS
jgi:hypothetical protein